MKSKLLIVAILLGIIATSYAQESVGPTLISQGRFVKKTEPLRDFALRAPAPNYGKSELTIIPNNLRANEKVNSQALPIGLDPAAQRSQGTSASFAPQENFDGITASEGQATPPDPSGAVGPNHYVHAVNLVVKIFDKQGNELVGPVALGNFLGNGFNNGDPIVMYDQLADRYFVSQFQTSNNALIIGISDTPDPTGEYNVYEFPLDVLSRLSSLCSMARRLLFDSK